MPDWTINVEAEFDDDEAYDSLPFAEQDKVDNALEDYVKSILEPLDLVTETIAGHEVMFRVQF